MKTTLLPLAALAVSIGSLHAQCTEKRVVASVVDLSGKIANKGRTIEGPVCVKVHFNPLIGPAALQTAETRAAGPDPGAVLGSAGKSSKGLTSPALPATVEEEFRAIFDRFEKQDAHQLPLHWSEAVAAQQQAIADLKNLLQATLGIDPSTAALSTAVNGVKPKLLESVDAATAAQIDYQPPDKGAPSLLAVLLEDQAGLNNLPIKYSGGWTAWYAGNKERYDLLVKSMAAAIELARQHATGSENDKSLKAKAGIVNYWKARLDGLGIRLEAAVDLLPFSVVQQDVKCSGVFNFNASIPVSLAVLDQRPTLAGNEPAVKEHDPFVTVTCGSRISVSAGAGFSTIRQKGFAIVKSAGEKGAAVNKFDTLSDSRFNPMPMALTHGRLTSQGSHLVGLHASFGVAGNFKGQESGGSAAEFLIGPSVSIARTIYLSLGLHIGTHSQLAGGFNAGDAVPAEITSLQGQVKRSYKTGFGFAVSFTKP